MKTLIVIFLAFGVAVPSFSGTVPSVSAQVNIVGDYKEYIYTLVNDLDYAPSIGGFMLLMPEAGARSVISFTASRPNWYSISTFRPEVSIWGIGPLSGHELGPGESVILTLITPADVPTSDNWDYLPPTYPTNWQWGDDAGPANGGFGSPNLPVPVPEPSAFCALAFGLAGLAAVRRRRR